MKTRHMFTLPTHAYARPLGSALSTGGGTDLPIGLTAAQAALWYHRVRKWDLAADLMLGGVTSLVDSQLADNHGSNQVPSWSVSSETELANAYGTDWNLTLEDGAASAGIGFRTQSGIGLSDPPLPQFHYQNGLYWPYLYLTMDFGNGFVTVQPSEDAEPAPFTFSVTLGDASFDVPMWYVGPVDFIVTGTLTLSPGEFWPYANEDGSDPWWDASSGEPIGNNPLVGA